MTKTKIPNELSEDQLETIRGGGPVGLGTNTVIQDVSASAVAVALSATSGSSAGSNGGTTIVDAPPQKPQFIGGPPVFDKARHNAMLSTIRNTM